MSLLGRRFQSPSSYMVFDEPFPDSPCRANLHKWGLAQSPYCDCGQRQTMNHNPHCRLVPINEILKFEGGLNLLHRADDDAVIWLESISTSAVAK